MDVPTQTQQSDQPLSDQQTQSPSAPSVDSNEDNLSMQRGDVPMKITDSIQATQAAENKEMNEMNVVGNAQSVNGNTLENETGEMDKGNTSSNSIVSDQSSSADQIRKLGETVEKTKGLPGSFKEILLERISRLAMIRSSAGFLSSTYIIEYEQTARYINWAADLPWASQTEDTLDLAKAKESMDKHHFGLEPLKQRVLEYIASVMLNIRNNKSTDNIIKSPILCMVGLAGTGKTTFAISLAEALGRKCERIPFGGMADSRVLRGQSRFFPDAEPGAIIKKLAHAETKNPVILLDELDRVTDTARADIMGVLIEILDPEQNATFSDHYIDYPFNLQNILFVATANNVSSIATAVLDRLEIIHMPSYNDTEKIVIGRDFVLPKSKKMTGLLPEQLIIDDEVWEPLVRPLGYDPGVRGLDRLITNMCRKAATIIITGQAQTVRITNENIKQFLPEW
jgi:ATP-dependent Lon protease